MTRDEKNARLLTTDHLTSGLGRRAASGSAIAFSAAATRMGLILAGTVIMARLLQPADFGLVAMGATVTALVTLFADFGLSAATVQRKDINQRTVSFFFYVNLLAGAAIMALVMGLSGVAGWFYDEPRLQPVLAVMATAFLLSAFGAQHSAILTRTMRWKAVHGAAVLSQASGLVAAVLSEILFDTGYWALVVQNLTVAGSNSLYLWIASGWRPNWITRMTPDKSGLKFGAFLTGFNIVNYLHRNLDNTLVGWYWGASLLGFYSRGYALFYLPQFLFSTTMNGVLTSLLSRSREQPEAWRRNVLDASIAVSLAGGFVAMMTACLAQDIVWLLLGPKWATAAPVLAALAPALALSTGVVIGPAFIASGNSRGLMVTGIINSLGFAACFAIAVSHGIAAVGAAYSVATVISVAVNLAVCFAKGPVRRRDYVRSAAPYVLLFAVMCGLYALVFPWGALAGSIGIFIVRALLLTAGYAMGALLLLHFDPMSRHFRERVWGMLGTWRQALLSRRARSAADGQPG